MDNIHVHPGARIGTGVTIEQFSIIAENVEIGEGTWIGPHVIIMDYVKIGANCKIFPGAIIGGTPQDYKFGDDGKVIKEETIRSYYKLYGEKSNVPIKRFESR